MKEGARVMAEKEEWVIEALKTLKQSGQWSGRFRAHKTLFLVEALGLAKPPFEFELYQYGPYSFDLDATFVALEAEGRITSSYPKPGYGAMYKVASESQSQQLTGDDRSAIEQASNKLCRLSTNDVELVATCVYAQRRLGASDDDAIVDIVGKIKPKYEKPEIREALIKTRKIQAELKSGH